MRSSILENIIKIQKESALTMGANVGKEGHVHWVKNSATNWPNFIIGSTNEAEVKKITFEIEQKQLPPFWIMAVNDSSEQINLLEKAGFREVNRWEAMWLNRQMLKKVAYTISNIEFNIVEQNDLMADWLAVVLPIMLPNKTISEQIIEYWLNDENYILILASENDKCVSAGMAFIDRNVAGIYFIATEPAYRGKGIASVLVAQLIEECFAKGVEEVVLHSSMAGKKMYEKMGFKPDGLISTFWKVGMV